MGRSRRKVFGAERFPLTKLAARIAGFTTLGAIASLGSCSLLIGGLHGLVITAVGLGLVGLIVGGVGVVAGFIADGSRAAAEALDVWHPEPGPIETEAGQLAVSGESRRGTVSVSAPDDADPDIKR